MTGHRYYAKLDEVLSPNRGTHFFHDHVPSLRNFIAPVHFWTDRIDVHPIAQPHAHHRVGLALNFERARLWSQWQHPGPHLLLHQLLSNPRSERESADCWPERSRRKARSLIAYLHGITVPACPSLSERSGVFLSHAKETSSNKFVVLEFYPGGYPTRILIKTVNKTYARRKRVVRCLLQCR